MFLEPDLYNGSRKSAKSGWIEVICGSMFSGKTEELIRRVNRAYIAKQNVIIFKPEIDSRYDAVNVVSHNKNWVKSIPLKQSEDILHYASEYNVIAIDEAQFFDEMLPFVCQQLANEGKRVIVAGLDMDYQGKPFGSMPYLMCVAEFVTKVHAICVNCGGVASYSFRLDASEERILLGETNEYEARCRKCFHEETIKRAMNVQNRL